MKMNKNLKRDYEYYNTTYECCVRSGGSDITKGGQYITRGGYGLMRAPVYEENNALTVGKIMKRALAILCGAIFVCCVLVIIAGFMLLGKTQVDNIGGMIYTFGYQMPVKTASLISTVSIFGGAIMAFTSLYLCDKLWYSAL